MLGAGPGKESLGYVRSSKPAGAGSTGGRLRVVGLIIGGRCRGNTGGITPTGRKGAPAKRSKVLRKSRYMSKGPSERKNNNRIISVLQENTCSSHRPASKPKG